MSSREEYFFNQIVENYNTLMLNFKLLAVERDTLLVDNNELRNELLKAYREISQENVPIDVQELLEKTNVDKYKLMM